MQITLVDVDNIQDKAFKLHRTNGREDYLFVLFKSPAKVMVEGEYVYVDYGAFIIYEKEQLQSYYACNNEKFVHDFLYFNPDTDHEKFIFSKIPKGKLLNISIPNTISSILTEIKNELNNTYAEYRREILTNLGTVFLYRLKNEFEKSSIYKINYYTKLHNLRLDVYRNPQLDWSVDNMVQKVNLSRSYFQSLYKSFFSASCTEDVIKARIAQSKILLLNSTLTIKEIADRCGYSNTEHFIRQFKGKIGTSPKQFRNR